MKLVKSLMLGSAAGLVAMSGAQAADLPVKAKAVEYVKVCSLYGAGFYYIPGTDTCIKLGGYLRAEIAFNATGVYRDARPGTATPASSNRLSNYYHLPFASGPQHRHPHRDRIRRGPHLFRLRRSPGPPALTRIAGGSLGVYFAFIQFAGFTFGKAVSQFDTPWSGYPGNIPRPDRRRRHVTGINQFSYTAQFGNGVSATISAAKIRPPIYQAQSVQHRRAADRGRLSSTGVVR